MMTPEQIDAALGALQQQIDDLRADGLPYAPKTCCGKDIVTEGGICTHCPYAPPEFQSHPDPAVAQLQRAVKQAGERLATLEQIHADGTPPEGSVGHDFLCDRLDAIEKRLATLENVAGETPRELRDRLTRHVSNSNHWLCTVEERVTALEDNAHTPVENDLSRIQALEQIHADGMPQTSQCTTCGNAPAYLRWREPWPGSRLLCDGCFEAPDHPASLDGCCGKDIVTQGGICTDCPYAPPELQSQPKSEYSPSIWRQLAGDHIAAADFPPIATQEQVAAAYADRLAVAPSLKQRFSDWIDARTAQGIETYGGPLQTDNGRDAERDAFQELLDFCQYQEQSRQEILAANAVLRERVDFAKKLLGLRSLPNKD